MGADGAGYLADGDLLLGVREPVGVAAHLVVPAGELQPERCGLGVDAVAAAHREGVLVLAGTDGDRLHEGVHALLEDLGGLDELKGEAGVDDV